MIKFLSKKLLTVSLLAVCNIYSIISPPELTNYDAYTKSEEILKVHAVHKTLNTNIMQRSLIVFIEKIDPIKIYLLDNEVDKFINANKTLLTTAVTDYNSKKFTTFTEIYELFLGAIIRRNALEATLDYQNLPKISDYKEIEKLGFPKNEKECCHKLRMIRSIQEEAITLLEKNKQNKQREFINRKRVNKEKEFITESPLEQKRMIHSLFLKSVAEALDSHTNYFTPHEAKQFIIHVQQKLFGIGALLSDSMDGLTVVKVLKGGPALKDKLLKKDDKIIAIDDQSIIGMDLSEAVELIRGPKKSPVTLTIMRETDEKKENIKVKIIRDEIVVEDNRYSSETEPFGDGVIAHLHLHSFYDDNKNSSIKDLRREILKIQREDNLKGIILDLRNNGGGLLQEAVNVCSLFLNKGIIAAIRTHTGDVMRLRNLNSNKIWNGPLIVLTNKGSASASEIVALTLSDYGRAIIAGDKRTFGKGTHQSGSFFATSAENVNPKGEYKVTGGVYYTVGGKSPQLDGVKADIEIPGIYSKLDIGEKFSKYPLENDSIAPLFVDDLADIHPLFRGKIRKALEQNPQKQESIKKYLPTLAQSSKRYKL